MNANLNKTSVEDIIFFDIETVRANEELEIGSAEYQAFRKKTRDRETDEYLSDEDLQKLYKRKAALYPAFSKIVCISLAYVRGNTVIVTSLTGEESQILIDFSNIVNNSKGAVLCGWNIIGFDLPRVRVRAFGSGLDSWNLGKANDSGSKPWVLAEYVLDLMDIHKGTGYYNESLDEGCLIYGVPSPKDALDGSMVSDEYYANGVDNIAVYCEKDTVSCVQILLRMKGLPLVTEIVRKVTKGTTNERSMIDQIFMEGHVSGDQLNIITDFAEENGLDKKIVGEILTAAVGDKKAKIELE